MGFVNEALLTRSPTLCQWKLPCEPAAEHQFMVQSKTRTRSVDHLPQPFGDLIRRFSRCDANPFQFHLSPEPGHLTFGKLPCAQFHELDRLFQSTLSLQMLDHLPIPQRLRGGLVFAKPLLQ